MKQKENVRNEVEKEGALQNAVISSESDGALVQESCVSAQDLAASQASSTDTTLTKKQKVRAWLKNNKEFWIMLYFPMFFLSGFLINTYREPIWWIYTPADAFIPCVEFFIIPYVLWYAWIPFTLLLLYFKDRQAYRNMCFVLICVCTFDIIFYASYPNGCASGVGDPFEFLPGRDNFFVDFTLLIKSGCNPHCCLPSGHCSFALGIDIVLQRSNLLKKHYVLRTLCFLFAISVCCATVFLKQHSILDVVAAAALVLLFNLINVFWGWYRESKKERKEAEQFALEVSDHQAMEEAAASADQGV